MPDAEAQPRTRIFVTLDAELLGTGVIHEVLAVVEGDRACFGEGLNRCILLGEGSAWHRQRWAAVNYARGIRNERLMVLRLEVDRLERMDFGAKP